HFVTRHVRRRLEALWAAEEERRGPVAILFCPEGELHEISLLGVAARLRASGYRPVILGPNLPVESAIQAAEAHHADLAAVSVTYLTTPAAARTLGAKLAPLSRRIPVFLGGRSAELYRKELEASTGVRVVTLENLEGVVPAPAPTRRASARAAAERARRIRPAIAGRNVSP
ncbi:MAG: B12-binding domain-containing protein, partial [Acidithiobacillales bacterium]